MRKFNKFDSDTVYIRRWLKWYVVEGRNWKPVRIKKEKKK